MYLPTFPAMAEYFSATPSMVQLGLTFSMIGLAFGQLIFGPLSDRYGRRPPLLVAMFLFMAATVGGGLVSEKLGWQGIFWCLFAIGTLILLATFRFRESLPAERRSSDGMRKMFSGISGLFKNRKYMCYVLQFGFAQGALFANISSAPFIMQGHYGFSPMLFSVCFGINALAIVIFAALSVKFRTMEKALMTGSVWMLVFSAFLCAVLCLDGGFWAYETMLVGLLASLGLTFTASNTLAMDAGRECAGTASALLGAAGFIFGGAVSVLAGIGNVMVSAGILFFVCSACALVCNLTAGENPRFYLKKALLIGRQ